MENNPQYLNNPYNFDAEIYVLGSIILDNTIMASLKGRLQYSDFYIAFHQNLYKTMERLYKDEKQINLLNLTEFYEILGFGKRDEVKNQIAEIAEQIPSAAYIDTYVEIVKEKATERLLLQNINDLKNDIVNNNLEYNEVLEKAESSLYNVIKERRTSDTIEIAVAAQNYYEDVLKRAANKGSLTGIDTGYPLLNQITNGFQNGEFIVIAARPGVGKTAFSLNLARNMAKAGKRIGFFSLEMSVEQIMQRMFSMQANVDSTKIRTGDLNDEEKIALQAAKQNLSNYEIYFDESGASTIGDIRSKCRQLKQNKSLDIVIIDYLQLINTNNKGNRQEGVSEISRSLKQLSRELKIPVIALSQLSRSIEQRENKTPQLSDLRESGSIEQDADIVMFIYKRSDVEEEESPIAEQEELHPEVKSFDKNIDAIILDVLKNRQGGQGKVDFDFYKNTSHFQQSIYQRDINHKKSRRRRGNN